PLEVARAVVARQPVGGVEAEGAAPGDRVADGDRARRAGRAVVAIGGEAGERDAGEAVGHQRRSERQLGVAAAQPVAADCDRRLAAADQAALAPALARLPPRARGELTSDLARLA